MSDKNFRGIAMDHMSVANHAEMLKKSMSPAGHAHAFQQVQQPQQQQQTPAVPAPSTAQTNNSK